MTNYKETTVAGQSWVRSHRVIIDNPLNGVPEINFLEEKVVDTGTVVKTAISSLQEIMTNPAQTFNLYDANGVKTLNTATYADVYSMLRSLYLTLAAKRDGY